MTHAVSRLNCTVRTELYAAGADMTKLFTNNNISDTHNIIIVTVYYAF